jgi:hypothetical protein
MNGYFLIGPRSAFFLLIECGTCYQVPSFGHQSHHGSYYADDHCRNGRHYRDRRMTRRDRVFRGRDGRYYYWRGDSTTRLVAGGAIGSLLGREVEQGRLRCN